MSFREAFPILQTTDVPRAVTFCVRRLGFEERYRFPDSGEAAFVVVGLNTFDLGLAQSKDETSAGRVALWVYCDAVDAEIAALREMGVEVAKEPEDQEWGERMASVCDPDGNEVFLGQRLVS